MANIVPQCRQINCATLMSNANNARCPLLNFEESAGL